MATKTRAELEAEIAELKRMLAERDSTPAAGSAPVTTTSHSPMYFTTPSTDVVVVYTSHSLGHMQGSQFSLDASVFGEEFTLTRTQFDELVGKYRKWFDEGKLAVSYKNLDVAAAKGLPTDRDIGLSVKELRSLGKMSVEQIEKLWEKANLYSLRMSIVTYFKEKFLAAEPGYRDRARIDCLNRLTDGGFDAEAQTVGGRPVKLQPVDLVTL